MKLHVMKTRLFFLLFGLFLGNMSTAAAQSGKKCLYVRLVSHEGIGNQDDNLNNLLQKIIQETPLKEDYREVHIRHSGYDDDINHLTEDAIVSFSPTKYVLTKDSLREGIIPILVVEKERGVDGFYKTRFITSLHSNIQDIKKDFDKINTFYFVNQRSTSGYVYALKELQKLGLLEDPCFCELQKKGIQVYFTNEHKFVQEAVAKKR